MAARSSATSAADYLPGDLSLPSLEAAARHYRGCDLYRDATQTVFGVGRGHARLILVGEQPGDQEDQAGEPFIGPAGRLLDKCLVEAGIEREEAYVTNAVKHFKWEPRGKLRIHKKATLTEVKACKPWLAAEIAAIRPRLIVCLGATAAQSLLGGSFRVTQHRGELQALEGYPPILATVHPSSVLRAPDEEARRREHRAFVADLLLAARFVADSS